MHSNNPHLQEDIELVDLAENPSEANNSDNPQTSSQQEEFDSDVTENLPIQGSDQDSDSDNPEESLQQESEAPSRAESTRLLAEEHALYIPTHRVASFRVEMASSRNPSPTERFEPLPSTSANIPPHIASLSSMEMMEMGNPPSEVEATLLPVNPAMRNSCDCMGFIKWILKFIFCFTLVVIEIDSLMNGLGQVVDSISGDYRKVGANKNSSHCPARYSLSGQLTYDGGPLWAIAIVNLIKLMWSILAVILTGGLLACRPVFRAMIAEEHEAVVTPTTPPLPDAHPLPPLPPGVFNICDQAELLLIQNPNDRMAQIQAAELLGIQHLENPTARPQPAASGSTSRSDITTGSMQRIQPLRAPLVTPQAPRYTPTTRLRTESQSAAPFSNSTLNPRPPSYTPTNEMIIIQGTPPLVGPPPPVYSEIDFSSPPDESGPPLSTATMQSILHGAEGRAPEDQPSGLLNNSNIEEGLSHRQNQR